jgi:hypothetical protein
MSTEDDQWLDALAGKPDPSAPPRINREAAALRLALLAHRADTEPDEAVVDEVLFERVLAQLKPTAASATNPTIKLVQGAGEMRLPVRSAIDAKWFALAASLVLGLGIVINSGRFLSSTAPVSDVTVVRGTPDTTVLIVADPKTRARELVDGLGSIGEKAEIQTDTKGRTVVSVARSDAVLAYLMDQRILPLGTTPEIVLVLEQTKR